MPAPYRLKRTVAPTSEALTVAEVTDHVREDSAFASAKIESLIRVAREHVELRKNCTLLTTTWQLTLDAFPCNSHLSGDDVDRLDLPRCPVQSVSSIAYVDTDGTTQTLSASLYTLDNSSDFRASIYPAYGEEWPDTRERPGAVTVTYIAGHTLAANVLETDKQAMLLLIGHWYENREGVLTGTISKPIEFAVDALLGLTDLSSLG